MSRAALSPLAASLALLLACGGGGGGGGSTSPSNPSASALDADPNATPAPDASYYKVPSTSLGPVFGPGTVSFSYWNPNAASVSLCLYAHWNDALNAPAATVAMTRGSGGVWSTGAIALPAQSFYIFKVGGEYVLDPYAKSMAQWVRTPSASITGDSIGKGAIIDPASVGPDGGWTPYAGASYYFDGSAMKGPDGATAAPYAFASNRDAIIYEAGVRDLTVDPNLSGFAAGHTWGTFKGLVDLLPHIQKLGVTHVQLLCPLENYTYDQTKIGTRELDIAKTSGANYNWGYDPQNYFTPTGMYSAAPTDPVARINELKTLVNEIHKQGMGVILDVVYNHTANNAVLGDTGIQGYYYRSTSRNGAGSQDVRSEAKMVRKLIVDSIAYWVREYKVDGFRFDLMGVLDTQTVKAAYAAASSYNPKTLFIGEGWNGFYSGPATDYNGDATTGADQGNSAQFLGQNVAMFSDSYRQVFKNGYPNDGQPAFLTGVSQSVATLFSNIAGVPTNTSPTFAPGSTSNVASYLTCHDNLCLYDVLAMATASPKTAAGDAILLKRAKVGYAALLTSQGLAFIHAGDEMFRTKETTGLYANTKSNGGRYFVDNSYNASDAINLVAWSRVYTSGNPLAGGFTNYDTTQNGYQLYRYVQGLIALRKNTNAFRLPDAVRAASLTSLPASGAGSSALAFGYKAVSSDGTGTWYVFHNADTTAKTFTADIDLATATLVADGATAGTTAITASTGVAVSGSSVILDPLTSAIFRK
ncbi:alpha-amylase family glycosyl hydrolase [Geothrix mesophila]|uniref:alpha-amylase family glycosyl hydrolase n=1 Tax=Geothrix mesophila TaxID=2922723 RepID=UPI001FAC6ADB|nr:alpha-amylase family glycosyl hydrolase [Geothrix sp. SG198]